VEKGCAGLNGLTGFGIKALRFVGDLQKLSNEHFQKEGAKDPCFVPSSF